MSHHDYDPHKEPIYWGIFIAFLYGFLGGLVEIFQTF